MPVVVGVDLAWSPRNRSGVAVAVPDGTGYALESAATALGDEEILARGERLVAALVERGFALEDGASLTAHSRSVVEVYPHPALVNLLALPSALKYKRKPGRPAGVRAQAWRALKDGLRGLGRARPALRGLEALLQENDAESTGCASKDYEDRVDAVVCAYIGLHALHWGSRGCRIYGGLPEGAILVPIRPGADMS